MKNFFYLLLLLNSGFLEAQKNHGRFNLDFEKLTTEKTIPEDWFEWGDLKTSVDSLTKFSGKTSVFIKSIDSTKFGCITYSLPNIFEGKEITLEGYIKTLNVVGHAGLLLRIDKSNETIEFNNMSDTPIKSTTEWTKYSITLPYHNDAGIIYIGGLFSGTGKAWFDNFSVLIDGNNIDEISINQENNSSIAINDTEFDSGSGFYLNSPSEIHIEKLEKLGKLWGFLKYNSSDIAKGKYNFDYELIRKLKILDSPIFDKELDIWKEKLLTTNTNNKSFNYYLDFSGTSNPIFKNEASYSNMKFDDDGLKLIGLFRYWNMIEYLFPYKNLTDSNWDSILKKYIPKFLNADDELSYKMLLIELIKETDDTHAANYNMGNIVEHFFGLNEISISAKIIENQVIVSDCKNIQGLKVGDQILAFDGEDINKRITNIRKYTIASNSASESRDVLSQLFRTNKDSITITFKRKNRIRKTTVKPLNTNYLSKEKPSHLDISSEIGYIYLGSLKKDEIEEILEKFKSKKGLIFDLRCYPSDFIVYTATEYLLPEPKEFVRFSTTTLKDIGKFEIGNSFIVGKYNPNYYKGKVVVLIDENTQSSAEFTAMALKTLPNVKVIGSQTAGADGNVSEIILPGNVRTLMSGIGVFYPDFRGTQRIGIIPDIQISPTKKGIESKIDEVLERAIKYIKKGL